MTVPQPERNDLEFDLADGLAVVTLNAPGKRNAVSEAMARDLTAYFRACADGNGIRALLLRAEGKDFCTGRDLSEARPNEDAKQLLDEIFNPMLRALRAVPAPTVAAVNGSALGIGFGLALACDVVLAAENAKFASPFHRLGAALDSGGHFFLPALVGEKIAMDLIYTGRTVRGNEAVDRGLASRVVPGVELDSFAREYARAIAQGPTVAFREQKRLLQRCVEGLPYGETLDVEAEVQARLVQTPDFAEGLAAFGEKRRPVFTGEGTSA